MNRMLAIYQLLFFILFVSLGFNIVWGQSGPSLVDFDNPTPSGSSGDLLNGVFEGIDFGNGQWRWENAFDVNSSNRIFFDSSSGNSRSFTFSPAPQVLQSITVFVLTLSDDQGQSFVQTVSTGTLQTVQTGWTQPATTVTVDFTGG